MKPDEEMSGFEPIPIQERRSPLGIWMVVQERTMFFSKSARGIIFGKGEYFRAAYDAGTRRLLLEAASGTEKYAVRASDTAISCAMLKKLLEKECRYDLSVVRIRIPGIPAKSRKNAVIFDLTKIQTEKIKKQGVSHE